ncbi:hypothetical protein GJAV_G00270310 [Gymnothorax javanicus]|nr:hypothetical protein GJAV_G00270310 [Gymnothorax javanicus]
MDSIEKQISQDELGDVAEVEGESSENSGSVPGITKEEEQSSSSQCAAELEAEAFQLQAAAFRRDLVCLESSLESQDRLRDQAEEDIKGEVSSCQSLLLTGPEGEDQRACHQTARALVPLCEQRKQMTELIQRLQKSLEILPAAMMRVSTRSEALGAIKEEQRVKQELEAMLQRVENLRQIYSAEHVELTELKQSLEEEEEEEEPAPEKDDFSSQHADGSPYYSLWAHGDAEVDFSQLNKRNTWRGAGKNASQPPFHRFINSSGWMDINESALLKRYENADLEIKAADGREKFSRLKNKLTAFVRVVKTRDHPVTRMVRSFPAMVRDRSSWEWWTPLVLAVMLGSLLALLGTLTLQPAV